jgi:hypothetical protein
MAELYWMALSRDVPFTGSVAVKRTFEKYGTYLLPQAFPEGSPTHPAYGSGHATVAGAGTTVLKAWFDESYVLTDPVVPTPDGTALVAYTGPDADRLTLGGELNKVAANIASARNMAGMLCPPMTFRTVWTVDGGRGVV